MTAQTYETHIATSYNILNDAEEILTDGVQFKIHARKNFNHIQDNGLKSHIGTGIGYFSYWSTVNFGRKRNSTIFVQAGLNDEDMLGGTVEVMYLWQKRSLVPSFTIEANPFNKFLWTDWIKIRAMFYGQIGAIVNKHSSPTGFISLGIGLRYAL